jgi:hypothetical protein
MQTITAEEARSLSIDNNQGRKKRKKEFNKALEDIMVEIHDSAKAGSFRTKCYCKIDLLDEITGKLNQFGYEVLLDVYLTASMFFQNREQGIRSNMIEFEVIWK